MREKPGAFGYIVLKFKRKPIDHVMPWDFESTHETDGKIDGGIFHDHHHEPGISGIIPDLNINVSRIGECPQNNDVRLYRITKKQYKSTGTKWNRAGA